MALKCRRNTRTHTQKLLRRLIAAEVEVFVPDGVEIGSEYGVHPCERELLVSSAGWLAGLGSVVMLGWSGGGG